MKPTVEMCGFEYIRPDGNAVPCTYVKGHPASSHSWRTLRLEDGEAVLRGEQVGTHVSVLLEALARGDLDRYLEAILAGAHRRKHILRGVYREGS